MRTTWGYALQESVKGDGRMEFGIVSVMTSLHLLLRLPNGIASLGGPNGV